MNQKELEAYREFLQKLVNDIGRDDIGVSTVLEADGQLVFTLARGDLTHDVELPTEIVADKNRARSAMMAIITRLSKAVEREHLQAAGKTG